MAKLYTSTLIILTLILFSGNLSAQRKMEKLGRGVVATRSSTNAIFVSWRLLGTEPQDMGFNIYRSANGGNAVKLNASVLKEGTNWVDNGATMSQANTYFVKPVVNDIEQSASESYTLPANTPVQPFFKVPIKNTPGYSVTYVWVGDLDGDGEYDYVLDKQPTDATKTTFIEAYKRDGTFLWSIDLGPNSVNRNNISPGASAVNVGHGDNMTVYDINNDGKAEFILRSAGGVKFADGTILQETNNNKQFISVINGLTGNEISRTLYNNPKLNVGPMSGHMGIAYLDGINPSIVWESKNRNTDESFNEYTTAWDWKNGTLEQKWQYLSVGSETNGSQMSGHQIRTIDLDGDGKDEIIPMGFVIDDDGKLLYSLGDNDIFHGDRFFISDLDPARPGLEMYGIQQGYSTTGIMWYYCDAKTGEVLLAQRDPANTDLGRGFAGDLDPRYNGYEFHTFVDALYNVSGAKTSTALPSSYPNLRLWWDGDLGSENLDNFKFTKWNYLANREDRLYTASNVLSAPRNVPAFYGDIMGDWREEVIYESSDHNSLTIFTTPHPTTTRLYTLPHNPAYRNDMAGRGYYQSHMVDYFLGFDMKQPPVPAIQRADKYWQGNKSLIWDSNSTNWLSDADQEVSFANGDVVMLDIRGNNADSIRLASAFSPSKLWVMNPEGKDYIIAGPGKLTGAMELVKAQSGKISLYGNHDFTGQTSIVEGSLSINGDFKSPVTVQSKGSLEGTGILNGKVTLEQGLHNKGGRISPGNTAGQPGTLTINGDLLVPGFNNFAFNVVPGSLKVNDSLIVKGNLTVTGTNKIIVNFKDDLPTAGTYTLISCLGTLSATSEHFTIEGISGVPKELIIENNQIKLKILPQRNPANVKWRGATDSNWDFIKNNFELNGSPTAFVSKDNVLFEEDASQKSIVLNEAVNTSGLTFNTGDYIISGTGSIGGAGGITKSAANNSLSLLLKRNTYSGKTIINGGNFTIANISFAGQPSSLGTADANPENIVISNALFTITDSSTTNRAITFTGDNRIHIPEKIYTIFTGDLIGAGQLIKEGMGSVYMVGKKNLTGSVIIREGIANLRTTSGNEAGLGTGPITIENATLNMDDARGSAQIRWNIIVPDGKTATVNTDGRSTLLGTLTGNGTLNVKIPYVRTDFKGDWSAFTGKINISGSDFRIGNNKGYANASLNLTEGTIYTISGSNNAATIGELSGAAKTTLSAGTWTVGSKNTDAEFAGNILGNSIVKVGTGTWTLTGNNTYTGSTNVNAGKLLVNNNTNRGVGSGIVTVASGGTIGGTGSIKGALIITSGARLEPGSNAIGTLTDSTSVTLSSGSTAVMEVNRTTKTNDVLKVVGSLTLDGTLSVSNANNAAFILGDSFKLFDATTITGNFTTIEPAVPGEGLLWNFSNTTGVLSVIADPSVIFTLPAKNFRVSATDETCNTSNNGKINIAATEPLNYSAVVNGNAANVYTFSAQNPLEISGLSAGNYNVCIGVSGKPAYHQCFDIIIAEPPALSVYSSVNNTDKTVSLNLSGGENYEVSLNGKVYNTRSGNITLNLIAGNNSLSVSTDKECQGTFTRSVFLEDKKLIYPNPFDNIIKVNLGDDPSARASVVIYTLNGAKVYAAEQIIINKEITMDLSALYHGNYIIKVKTDLSETISNIIKK